MGMTPMPEDVMNGYNWELYNLDKDPTQFNDLAAKMPKKLQQMKDIFTSQATKYNVFPLDNNVLTNLSIVRPSPTEGRNIFTYTGPVAHIPHGAAPSLLNRSYTITAQIEVPKHGAEGMLVTQGGRFGGYGFYLLKGVPVFLWNYLDQERTAGEDKRH